MFKQESEWFREVFARYEDEALSPLLNIGSSTADYRENQQPHIHQNLFAPLQKRGVKVIHSDLKKEPGVDIAGDFHDDEVLERIQSQTPGALVCTHMFEHVEDRELLADRLMEMLPDGGLFFITVPHSYHYHADPIDTMYRPSPDELAELFSGQEILEKKIINCGNYWSIITRRPVVLPLRHISRFLTPFLGMKKWKRSMRKLYWLYNPYQVSFIVGRKVSQPQVSRLAA